MFTGIVEETGQVTTLAETAESIRLQLRAAICGEQARVGDSLAVNGCCLTIVRVTPAPEGTLLDFDLLRETWHRTSFRQVRPGGSVNLERSLRADGRIHGHFVTGHVDACGEIASIERQGGDVRLRIRTAPEILRYVAPKGSIAVDGISLTVAEVDPAGFTVWIIPHTWAVTALRERQAGDGVNLEVDLLARYLEKLSRPLL